MSDKKATEIVSMVNVYQVAADIGKDFEGLIEKFGSEGFRDVMPKIIKSLEYLEEAVKSIDTQQENVHNLEDQVMKLEKESASKEKEMIKLIQEAEETAEKKREDDIFWMKQLSELQSENSLLMEQISEKEGIAVKERVQEKEAVKVLIVMKQTVEKQRNQLRRLEKDVSQKAADVDALQEQVDRLAKLNQSLHQKNELIEAHAQSLMKEKSQIITEMKAMEKEIPLQNSTSFEAKQNSEDTQSQVGGQSMDGMIVIDPKDPNRPRFTLHELYHVLLERDELKLKLFLMEEDLKSEEKLKESESPPRVEQKSEYSISKFFSSLFKSGKKKNKPALRENDSGGSSENNWEFLEKDDAPAPALLEEDAQEADSEKALIKVFEKYTKSKDDELELKEMVEGHFSHEEDGENLSSGEGGTEIGKGEKANEGSIMRRKLFVDDEGSGVDPRDENYNVNNNGSFEPRNQGDASEEERSPLSEEAASVDRGEGCEVDQGEGCEEESLDQSQPSSQDSALKEKEMEGSCDVVEL